MAGKRKEQLEDNVVVERRPDTTTPKLFKVLLHNDDFTTMEFVVAVLMSVFHHNEGDAHRIMLAVHHRGVGVAGLFPYETAEAKAARATDLARQNDFPLMCTVEAE